MRKFHLKALLMFKHQVSESMQSDMHKCAMQSMHASRSPSFSMLIMLSTMVPAKNAMQNLEMPDNSTNVRKFAWQLDKIISSTVTCKHSSRKKLMLILTPAEDFI